MDFNKYRITPEQQIKLQELETNVDDGFSDKELAKLRRDLWSDLADYQERLYAESKQSLLIVLQAMDAAGKDSTIAKLTSNLNVQGCKVHSFKSPTKKELSHDFLWRIHQCVPAAGEIALFNRSHYEDVLIVKVHDWAAPNTIAARYEHINNFESLLADRGTKVLKFMLNISPEYQLERFKRRLKYKEKNWKFNPRDLVERTLWDEYMQAFEIALNTCSTEQSPWYVVPAENRRYRDVMIASVILERLKEMNPQFPEPDFDTAKFTVDSIQ